jgi:tryptophan-rich sensory protein
MFENFGYIDYIVLLLPLISGYSVSSICRPEKSSGQSVKFRPAPWVFGVVWPILYLLLGFAWTQSRQYSLFYIILNILLNLWLIVYVCQKNKIGGIYIILLSLLSLVYILISVKKQIKYYLVPLLVWLLFALLLNTFEVQNK